MRSKAVGFKKDSSPNQGPGQAKLAFTIRVSLQKLSYIHTCMHTSVSVLYVELCPLKIIC